MMSVSISEICENTKMGREFALLGNYDTSLVYYQGVIQQIQKLLTSITDANRRSKWQQVNTLFAILSLFSSWKILFYSYIYHL